MARQSSGADRASISLVYLGKPGHKHNRILTHFPKRKQPNGNPMPQWDDLSKWLRMQRAVMLLDEWSFQTFNIVIHADLQSKWLAEGQDLRVVMRDRIRRELDRHVRPPAASTRSRSPT